MNEAQRKLRDLARALAATNPDAAEFLAEEMARQSEMEKAPPFCGITVRYNAIREQVEMRGGTYADYVTLITPVPRLGTRKE